MSYEPRFQAQNPEISHYSLGWSSCTAFSMAMAIDFATAGREVPTGGQVRTLTHDTTGGLTLLQVDAVALEEYELNFTTIYRLPFPEYVTKRNEVGGALLAGGYAPIADSRFDAGGGFRKNHCIFDQTAKTKDPLADGRRAGIYKYAAEPYPDGLLREFAGHLDLGSGNLLGNGLVYASFPPLREVPVYEAHVPAGTAYPRYVIKPIAGYPGRQIVSSSLWRAKSGFTAPCTDPKAVLRRTINETVELVKVLEPAGHPLHDVWIPAKYARSV